ncbi:MAG: threonine/serine dehydratase [Actinomycetota bacterium]|nr:threonine/serine dehydratase [Actinomycetota bacterium]
MTDLEAARDRLAGVARRTPVVTSRTLDALTGLTVLLKCENLQRTGSFKFRGAYNLISQLTPQDRSAGVCTISSGNHAQAVALSATLLGLRAQILMPADAPEAKVAATRSYGAEVVTYDRYSLPQVEAGRRFAETTGATFVSAYDDPRIWAGAATAAVELWEDAGPLDVLVAPIGGGGGICGYGAAVKARSPSVRVVGVESAASAVTRTSLAAGERVQVQITPHLADGQMLTTPGALTFPRMQSLVDDVVLVGDDEIVAAMVFLFDRLKLVAEPSGAIATAAVLAGGIGEPGQRVGVVISGGNVGARRFADLVAR